MTNHTQRILQNIKPLKQQLLTHDLYKYIETPDDLRIFMQHHVFAVWDFMSLLKSLQQKLTCIEVPWTPKPTPEYTYLINEIVLAEETDTNLNGERQSHFAMYLEAMRDIEANTESILKFTEQIQHGTDIFLMISASQLPKSVKSFLIFTFNTIYHKQLHQVASAFTFGREELIPEMFTEIIVNIQDKSPEQNTLKLKYYFERHIEIDGDEHGPMAIKLIEKLCGNDTLKWDEVEQTAIKSLKKRLELFDGILKAILNHKAIA
jgi:hypothetical protein